MSVKVLYDYTEFMNYLNLSYRTSFSKILGVEKYLWLSIVVNVKEDKKSLMITVNLIVLKIPHHSTEPDIKLLLIGTK